jgi:hypothetical protein
MVTIRVLLRQEISCQHRLRTSFSCRRLVSHYEGARLNGPIVVPVSQPSCGTTCTTTSTTISSTLPSSPKAISKHPHSVEIKTFELKLNVLTKYEEFRYFESFIWKSIKFAAFGKIRFVTRCCKKKRTTMIS